MEKRLFEKAKEVDLVAFFESELNAKGSKYAQGMRFDVCPDCGESHQGSLKVSVRGDQWRCHKCGKRGSVIDAAAFAWGMNTTESAKKLAGDQGSFPVASIAKSDRDFESDEDAAARQRSLEIVLDRLIEVVQENRDDPVCLQYLAEDRAIPKAVVREAQARKIIGFLPSEPWKAREFLVKHVGKDLLHQSGLWKKDAKLPGICYRPIIAFLPGGTSAEFRIAHKLSSDSERKALRYGATLFPWFWSGEESRVMIVEGVIDLLSAVALGFKGHVVGVPGCNNWKPDWFLRMRDKRNVQMFYVALDNDDTSDNPGQAWAKRMSDEMAKLGLPHQVRTPPKGCDINDLLRQRSVSVL